MIMPFRIRLSHDPSRVLAATRPAGGIDRVRSEPAIGIAAIARAAGGGGGSGRCAATDTALSGFTVAITFAQR